MSNENDNVGFVARPTLNGTQLVGIDPNDFRVTETRGWTLVPLARGDYRRILHFTALGYPDVKVIYRWRIEYSRIRKHLDYIDWLLRPEVQELCVWKHARVSWTVLESQEVFFLPWRPAEYVIPYPSEDASGLRLKSFVTTDPTDKEEYEIVEKETGDFDSETPGAGEVFFETTGGKNRIKVAGLTSGTVLYASVVPVHRVFATMEKTPRPLFVNREGRSFVFQETQLVT